jgi:hypothetical protein
MGHNSSWRESIPIVLMLSITFQWWIWHNQNATSHKIWYHCLYHSESASQWSNNSAQLSQEPSFILITVIFRFLSLWKICDFYTDSNNRIVIYLCFTMQKISDWKYTCDWSLLFLRIVTYLSGKLESQVSPCVISPGPKPRFPIVLFIRICTHIWKNS